MSARRGSTRSASCAMHVALLLLAPLAGCGPSVGPPSAVATAPSSARAPSALDVGRLPTSVEPVSYALELTIDPARASFSGLTRIEVELTEPRESILLHGAGLRIERATVRATDAAAAHAAQARAEDGLLALHFGEPLGPGRIHIELAYAADFDQHLLGLYRVESGGRAYAFTQFEAIHARQAFPCFDEPRFKTPFEIRLRVPRGAVALSNTQSLSVRELPDGMQQVEFARTEKLPTYLVAFAVGPFDVVSAGDIAASSVRPTPLPLRGIAAAGRGAEMRIALGDTPQLLGSLERYTAVPYPYDKLDLIAVPDFAAGAMENAGAITFRDTLLLMDESSPEWQRRASVSVNAHELAHQWFGNLVTMPWWNDVWLNEAFATWLSGRVLDEVHPEFRSDLARIAAVDRAMDVDSRASARMIRQPIQSDHDIKNAFDAITYIKGSAVLGMFEQYLGEAAFRRGLRLYLQRHRFGSATAEDLLHALEEASAEPIAPAFTTFLEQPGVPSIRASLECGAGREPKVRLRQTRYVPLGSSTPREGMWQVPVCLVHGHPARSASGDAPTGLRAQGRPEPGRAQLVKARESRAEQCMLLTASEAEVDLGSPDCPSWILPNAGAKGYYRWSLEAKDFGALLERGFGGLRTAEQLSLLSNAEAAARAGSLHLDQLLALAERVGRQRPRELLQASLALLARLRDALFGEEELPAYRRLVRSLVSRRVVELGLMPAAPERRDAKPESGDDKLMRPLAVAALALEAKGKAIRRDLERLGRAYLGLAKDARLSRMPSELIEVALSVAVQNGGAPIIERIEAALATSTDGIERFRLLGALGNNEDPRLTPRILELSLGPILRNNERATPLMAQLRQPPTRDAAYAWITEHYDALVESLGKENARPLLQIAGSFCNETKLREARTLLTPRAAALPGGPRLLRLSLENVEACIAFANLHRPSAKAALAKTEERH